MPSNNDLAKRLVRLEQWRAQQQKAASNEGEDEESIDYGPHEITMLYVAGDLINGGFTLTKEQRLHIDEVEAQLRAEARAARCTQRWGLSITVNVDGSLDVSGPPWWPETPKSEITGRGGFGAREFNATAALASIIGAGSRRYA